MITKICLQCGKEFEAYPYLVKRGFGKFCSRECYAISNKGRIPYNKGKKCLKSSGKNNPAYKHGFAKTRFYKIWLGILKRCNNSNSTIYEYYGGRGISVCNRWLDFINFRDDMYKSYQEHIIEFGEKNTQIERIDNDGNYCPENCKWATLKEQANNKRKLVKPTRVQIIILNFYLI